MTEVLCPCGTGKEYKICCEPFHMYAKWPETAEQLMRSRYTAYVYALADYLVATTHPKTRHLHKKKDILEWATSNNWIRLEILESKENLVIFRAYYIDSLFISQKHFEKSLFQQHNGKWMYHSADFK